MAKGKGSVVIREDLNKNTASRPDPSPESTADAGIEKAHGNSEPIKTARGKPEDKSKRLAGFKGKVAEQERDKKEEKEGGARTRKRGFGEVFHGEPLRGFMVEVETKKNTNKDAEKGSDRTEKKEMKIVEEREKGEQGKEDGEDNGDSELARRSKKVRRVDGGKSAKKIGSKMREPNADCFEERESGEIVRAEIIKRDAKEIGKETDIQKNGKESGKKGNKRQGKPAKDKEKSGKGLGHGAIVPRAER